jgi:hypothetical protein
MVLGLLVAVVAGGCYAGHLFVALTKPEEKKTIKAEYPLEAEKLAIVVYAGTDVLFTYPAVPLEISRDLVNEILKNLRPKIKQIVHPVEVVRWQESNLDWTNMSPLDIAKTFKVDTLLYVEIEQYTTVEERSSNLFRGHIRANVQVVKVGAENNPVFKTKTPMDVLFPEDRPVGVVDAESQIRVGTGLLFAQKLINKFYDREIVVKAGKSE